MTDMNRTATLEAQAVKSKIEALAENEGFTEQLLANETPEEAQAFLKGYGIELSVSQLKAAGALIAMRLSGRITDEDIAELEQGRITETLLAEVSGGDASDELLSMLKEALPLAGYSATSAFVAGLCTGNIPGALVAGATGFAAGFIAGSAKWGIARLFEIRW